MSTIEKEAIRWDEILARLHSPLAYDTGRIEEIRRKHAAEPEPRFLCWQDADADDAGVKRFGEI